jgi:heme-degrading monooxygenase HmoA
MLSLRAYSEQKNPADTAASVQSFLGRWDLTLKTALREYPSWLEITQEDGQLRARMVSRWGHARPLPKIELSNGRITFVSPKEEEDRKDDMVFEGKLSGKTLVGTTTGPDGTPWQWTGERAPSLKNKRKRSVAMFTRTVEVTPKSGKARELTNTINEKVLPILKKQPGFSDETLLVSDTEPNQILALSFWNSKEDAERYQREQYPAIHQNEPSRVYFETNEG